MELKIYQIVVKYNVSNKISVYDYRDFADYLKSLEEIQKSKICIVITTNVYLKYE